MNQFSFCFIYLILLISIIIFSKNNIRFMISKIILFFQYSLTLVSSDYEGSFHFNSNIYIYMNIFIVNSDISNASYSSTNSSLSYPRIMWSFYDRPMQPIIKEMFDITWKNVGSKWEYNFLSYDNLSLFLNTSTFPSHFHRLLPAHQSDYIRMRLLEKYGGWWIDTALIINNNIIMEKFYKEILEKKAEYFGICNLQCPRKLVENGFFYAPKGSIVIKKWRQEMEEIHRVGQKNYIYNTYRSGITIPWCLFEPRYPRLNIYLTAFAAEQKVFDRLIPRNTSMIIKEGKKTLYAMQNYCYLNRRSYESVYFNTHERNKFPLIKINSWLRHTLFKGLNTVTAYQEKYDPVELKLGNNGYGKRLTIMIIYFLQNILTLISLICLLNFLFCSEYSFEDDDLSKYNLLKKN